MCKNRHLVGGETDGIGNSKVIKWLGNFWTISDTQGMEQDLGLLSAGIKNSNNNETYIYSLDLEYLMWMNTPS